MSSDSAFEKRYVDPKDQSNVEGLLEHFNLPPKVIVFLRKNKRKVQVAIAVVLIAVVAFSLYRSYLEKRVEEAASALAVAVKEPVESRAGALQNVAGKYDDTTSGTWANVELGHLAMTEERYEDAAGIYLKVREGLKEGNPLYGLAMTGQAQALEAAGKQDEAYAVFDLLKVVEGYQYTAYSGLARILEAKGEIDKAIAIYGQYLAILTADEGSDRQNTIIEERIARLKTKK
ncbi:tetratricopeptide repeat protein [Desulfopila sp. IMCC35008]|uniref:YfgM family protein n=1 Tax=Desulfopila sp. IMCC35008 TaxID=2653858 RepID=UPI0013D83EF1|nr:tetratricopeptide repeat protein [Desulfopila sp. IMCC35008]